MAPASLHPVATATSVRVREDKSFVTDGPFAETREQLDILFEVCSFSMLIGQFGTPGMVNCKHVA